MTPVSIGDPMYSMENDWHVASATVSVYEKTFQLKYKVSEGPLTKGSEPFLAAALLPAMKIGQPLRVSGTVSPKLLVATQTIQDMFHKWFPEFQKIPVEAEGVLSDGVRQADGVGAFFSGGVDSFYSLLKHQDEITKIIFVHGFDMMLEKTSLRSKVSREIRRIARELGKPLIEVETNVRELFDQYADFAGRYGGSVLPSIGLLLSPQFRKIYIPASEAYQHLNPDSSHPLFDPLWSTEMLAFDHDGCEADRIEKIASISRSDTALKSLRVCFNNEGDSYNCGQCEKCLRTMVSLQAVGALERCTAFDKKLDMEAVSQLKISYFRVLPFFEENLSAIEHRGDNPDLAEALRSCIKRYKYNQLSALLNENLKEFIDSDMGTQFVRGKKNMLFHSLWQADSGWFSREVFKEKCKALDERFLFGMLRKLYSIAKAKYQ